MKYSKVFLKTSKGILLSLSCMFESSKVDEAISKSTNVKNLEDNLRSVLAYRETIKFESKGEKTYVYKLIDFWGNIDYLTICK